MTREQKIAKTKRLLEEIQRLTVIADEAMVRLKIADKCMMMQEKVIQTQLACLEIQAQVIREQTDTIEILADLLKPEQK